MSAVNFVRTIRIAGALVMIILLAQMLPEQPLFPAEQQQILQVSPTSLSFEGQEGGPRPEPQYLTIANAGGGVMEWEASADADWIILGAEGGKLSGGWEIKLLVWVRSEGLEAGEYHGTITISSPNAQGSPVNVQVTLTLEPQPTYTVCLSGCRYSSISQAIQEAHNGDTITIGPGTYEENLVIQKGLTLRGAGWDKSIIKGKEEGEPVILIESDEEIEITVEGLTIAEAKEGFCTQYPFHCAHGLVLRGKVHAAILNNSISSNRSDGILIGGSSRGIIKNNSISDNFAGIEIRDSPQVEIKDNSISGNRDDGIIIRNSSQITITGNSISGNRADGIEMMSSSQATIEGNKITYNDHYGIVLYQRSCFDISNKFEGAVRGKNNEIHDNVEGDVCPADLQFLITSAGGVMAPNVRANKFRSCLGQDRPTAEGTLGITPRTGRSVQWASSSCN